jgi:hypothetical protein
VERHPLCTNTKDLGVRSRGVAQSKSGRADLFCGNVQPQGRKGRDVEVVERYQNLWDFFEGLLKLHDMLEVPLSFTIIEGAKSVIVISDSVIASLDMHWIGRFLTSANRQPNRARPLGTQCRELVAISALVLAKMES